MHKIQKNSSFFFVRTSLRLRSFYFRSKIIECQRSKNLDDTTKIFPTLHQAPDDICKLSFSFRIFLLSIPSRLQLTCLATGPVTCQRRKSTTDFKTQGEHNLEAVALLQKKLKKFSLALNPLARLRVELCLAKILSSEKSSRKPRVLNPTKLTKT